MNVLWQLSRATCRAVDQRAEEAAYDRWFRAKVMRGIAEAEAGNFATSE
jgi:predicted transcriptional regulator